MPPLFKVTKKRRKDAKESMSMIQMKKANMKQAIKEQDAKPENDINQAKDNPADKGKNGIITGFKRLWSPPIPNEESLRSVQIYNKEIEKDLLRRRSKIEAREAEELEDRRKEAARAQKKKKGRKAKLFLQGAKERTEDLDRVREALAIAEEEIEQERAEDLDRVREDLAVPKEELKPTISPVAAKFDSTEVTTAFPSFHGDEYMNEEYGIEVGAEVTIADRQHQATVEDYFEEEPHQTTSEIAEAFDQDNSGQDGFSQHGIHQGRVYGDGVYDARAYQRSVGEVSADEGHHDQSFYTDRSYKVGVHQHSNGAWSIHGCSADGDFVREPLTWEGCEDEGSRNEKHANEGYSDEGHSDEDDDVAPEDFPLPPSNRVPANAAPAITGPEYVLQPLSEVLVQASVDLERIRNSTRLGATASASGVSLSIPASVRGGETVDFDLVLENLDRFYVTYDRFTHGFDPAREVMIISKHERKSDLAKAQIQVAEEVPTGKRSDCGM